MTGVVDAEGAQYSALLVTARLAMEFGGTEAGDQTTAAEERASLLEQGHAGREEAPRPVRHRRAAWTLVESSELSSSAVLATLLELEMQGSPADEQFAKVLFWGSRIDKARDLAADLGLHKDHGTIARYR